MKRQPQILDRADSPKLHLLNRECMDKLLPICGLNSGIYWVTGNPELVTCARCLRSRRLKRYKEERS